MENFLTMKLSLLHKFGLYISVAFLFLSCKDNHTYRVDSAFTSYLYTFQSEAAKRGQVFNFQQEGLIMEFADLTGDRAGLCHFEKPIRIEIDQTYWNDISKYAGAEYMKEDVIFHELGHGFLGREHLNDVLENGDWKSMMCGGEKVDNRPWNINYRGIRRKYYLDELFNQNTPSPAFSTQNFPVDTSTYVVKVRKSFDTPLDAGWKIENTSEYETSIDNRRLKFESKIDPVYFVYAKINVDVQSDFIYQLDIECTNNNDSDQYGLIFGSVPDQSASSVEKSLEYFTINNLQKMYMGNTTWYSFYTELTKLCIISGNNRMKIVKSGEMLYYFINDEYCYCSEMEVNGSGYYFGFIVPPKSTVWLDNFIVSQQTAFQNVTSKVRELPDFETHIISEPKFRMNSIKNK